MKTKLEILADLDAAGITYDTALPQDWVNAVHAATGVHMWSIAVWTYPKNGSIFGEPVALTPEAAEAIEKYNRPDVDAPIPRPNL